MFIGNGTGSRALRLPPRPLAGREGFSDLTRMRRDAASRREHIKEVSECTLGQCYWWGAKKGKWDWERETEGIREPHGEGGLIPCGEGVGYEGPVINYGESGGGGLQNGMGGIKFYPYTKKGGRHSLSHAEGGTIFF